MTKAEYEENARRAVEEGEATRFDLEQGYLVLQRFGEELFVLFIKWERGKLNFMAMLVAVIAFAKANGCRRIAGVGRSGWDRKLIPLGFAKVDDELKLEVR